jgi:hypothetical protein
MRQDPHAERGIFEPVAQVAERPFNEVFRVSPLPAVEQWSNVNGRTQVCHGSVWIAGRSLDVVKARKDHLEAPLGLVHQSL